MPFTITLTFGEAAENHAGMQLIGKKTNKDFTMQNIYEIKEYLEIKGFSPQLHNISYMDSSCDAQILICKNFYNEYANELLEILPSLTWDKKVKIKGRVVNKHARYNLTFDAMEKNILFTEPNYEVGKGSIYNIEHIDPLQKLHYEISKFPHCDDLVIEGNYYYDTTKTYIGFHGDRERNYTIGYRIGETIPLHFQWYLNSKPITEIQSFSLEHGDLYIMDKKTNGNDWLKRNIPTLRHAAGENNLISKFSKLKKK